MDNIVSCDYLRHLYRPQRSCEGYVFTPVCLSTRGEGEYLGRYPPPPGPGTPRRPGTHPGTRYTASPGPGTPPDQMHPQTRYTPRTRYTPPDQVPCLDQVHPLDQVHSPRTRYTLWTRYPPGPGTPPGTRYPPGPGTPPAPGKPPWDQVPPQTATAADGTHPTGMHSCLFSVMYGRFLCKFICAIKVSLFTLLALKPYTMRGIKYSGNWFSLATSPVADAKPIILSQVFPKMHENEKLEREGAHTPSHPSIRQLSLFKANHVSVKQFHTETI